MQKEVLISLIADGKSSWEIASQLGIGQTTVRYWLKKHNLSTRRPKFVCECGETDPKKFRNDGIRFTECKSCHYKRRLENIRKRKLEAVAYKGGKCQKCGYKECIGSLQFHHRDPKQKDPNWRHMKSWSFSKLKIELDKCDLVCANCHGEKSALCLNF
jgi:hypothetical protein